MKTPKQIDVQTLQEIAKRSEHKEAYNVLEKSKNYRIGAGARLLVPDHPSYFLEILVYLCQDSSQVDISLLEKKITFLKELQGREYILCCQNDSSISCEISVSGKNLLTEYETIKLIIERIFQLKS